MKKYILTPIFLFVLIISLPSTGLALNSGAHIYVTEHVFDSADIDLLYGSIAPDLSSYLPPSDQGKWDNGFEDTHYNYITLWPQGWTENWKRFALGWMIHNEEWGEDWYSHISYTYRNGDTGNGYIIDKASILLPYLTGRLEPPYSDAEKLMAHIAVEFAIDILTQRYLDPDLGEKLGNVAVNRSNEDIKRLFNILVAKNKATDKQTLYDSETVFRNMITVYSYALTNSTLENIMSYDPYNPPEEWEPIAEFGANMAYEMLGVPIDTGSVTAILQAAIYFCSTDFNFFLLDTIDDLKSQLGGN